MSNREHVSHTRLSHQSRSHKGIMVRRLSRQNMSQMSMSHSVSGVIMNIMSCHLWGACPNVTMASFRADGASSRGK